jgi:hypothetical protein
MDAESRLFSKSSALSASSSCRTPDRPAGATSRLRIEDTTKCSRIARGFAFGSSTGFAAEVKPGYISFDHNWPFHSTNPDGLT